MQTNINAYGLDLTSDLRNYVEKRLNHILRFSGRKIRSVQVRLFDQYSAHGKTIKVSRVYAELKGMPSVVAESKSNDLYQAIHNSVHRARKYIHKKLRREKKLALLQHMDSKNRHVLLSRT